jgi:TatA/E family protein of Tat protein translocase
MLSFLDNIGPTEWVVIALIVVVFFGAGIARRLGRAGGETLREIKKVKKNITDSIEDGDKPK